MFLTENPMICEECAKEGKKSRVYSLGGTSTLSYCAPFYDEDGEYHVHDSNTTRSGYRCSNGHEWEIVRKSAPCPNPKCNFGKEDDNLFRQSIKRDDEE